MIPIEINMQNFQSLTEILILCCKTEVEPQTWIFVDSIRSQIRQELVQRGEIS